jgi:hypothetical protein
VKLKPGRSGATTWCFCGRRGDEISVYVGGGGEAVEEKDGWVFRGAGCAVEDCGVGEGEIVRGCLGGHPVLLRTILELSFWLCCRISAVFKDKKVFWKCRVFVLLLSWCESCRSSIALRRKKKPRAIPPALASIYPTPPNSQTIDLTPLLPPPHPGSPLSPPAEDVDEMDWTPSQEENFQSDSPAHYDHQYRRLPTLALDGRLPAQPISFAARLRNPPNRPHLRRIPEDKKEALVNNMRGYSSSNNEDAGDGKGKKHPIAMANLRFFPSDEYSRDIGLKSLFDSLHTRRPPEVAKAMKDRQQAGAVGRKGPITSIKPARLWKEWLVPAFLAIPVIVRLYWTIVGVRGIVIRVIGAREL